jgi:SNF2 family DNA or RNA helicase
VGDRIVLSGTAATQVPLIRQIPGARFNTKERTWTFPLSWASCQVARGVFGPKVELGDDLIIWARQELSRRIQPAHHLRDHGVDPDPDSPLYPYQQTGAAFLNTAGSALLADEMGTGKTVQTVRALEEAGSYPALIVCPNGVKQTWQREFARWAPGRRVVVTGGTTEDNKRAVAEVTNGLADVLVVHYEALRYLSRLAGYGSIRLQGCSKCEPNSKRRADLCQKEDKALNMVQWAAVVADEAHRAKNPKADQTRALWALGDRADRRIALTGTPIANSAEDLWSIMRFVAPEEYPAKTAWIERYAVTAPNFWSPAPDVLGLKEEMRPELDRYFLPRFLRRTKAEVLPDLPEKVYERREVLLSGKQKRAYDQLKKGMMAEIEAGIITADNILTAHLRLRQLAAAYGTVVRTEGKEWDEQVKLTEPSSKLDELEDVLMELGDQQTVVFAESSQLIRLAAARLDKLPITYVTYTGDDKLDKRTDAVALFTEGKAQVFLATVAAGGEGLDGLQVADTCVFLQRPWSAVVSKQAEDRLHRVGQTGQCVTYIDIVTVNDHGETVEDEVIRALKAKHGRAQDVLRDKEE